MGVVVIATDAQVGRARAKAAVAALAQGGLVCHGTGDPIVDPEEPVHWAWNTGHHSNSLIPCYFRGVESHRFAGLVDGVDPRRGKYIDNVDVFEVMLGVLRR